MGDKAGHRKRGLSRRSASDRGDHCGTLDGESRSLEAGLSQLQVVADRTGVRPRRPRSPPDSRRPADGGRSCSTRCWPTRERTTVSDTSTTGWPAATSNNEASDESVAALVDAVDRHYDSPAAVVRVEGPVLGVRAVADRPDGLGRRGRRDVGWSAARELVLDAYASFSPDGWRSPDASCDEGWIDAPVRPASGRERSARTPCRHSTRTCCSTGPRSP